MVPSICATKMTYLLLVAEHTYTCNGGISIVLVLDWAYPMWTSKGKLERCWVHSSIVVMLDDWGKHVEQYQNVEEIAELENGRDC